MNTTTPTVAKAINLTKLNKAIQRLEALCNFEGQCVIEQLQDYEGLPFIDLLIKTGIDSDDLKDQLQRLLQSGVVQTEELAFATEYSLNYNRLASIAAIAKILAKN